MAVGEYGIVANVVEPDRVFRLGAKAWLVTCESGAERARWLAMSRGGRTVEKHSPLTRFDNFRSAWMPEHLRKDVHEIGDKDTMAKKAAHLNTRANEERCSHPNRTKGKPL